VLVIVSVLVIAVCWWLQCAGDCGVLVIAAYSQLQCAGDCSVLVIVVCWQLQCVGDCSVLVIAVCSQLQCARASPCLALSLCLSMCQFQGEIAKAKQAMPIYQETRELILQKCRQVSPTRALPQCVVTPHCASHCASISLFFHLTVPLSHCASVLLG